MEKLPLGDAIVPTEFSELSLRLPPHVGAELLNGGQAFTWNPIAENAWRGVWRNHCAEIRFDPLNHSVTWRPLTNYTVSTDLLDYLGTHSDQEECTKQLPWRSDPILRKAIEAFPGLKILNQSFDETLLGFLCSSSKRIVQIKEILNILSVRYGRKISEDHHALPTWQELANVSEIELRSAKLGYRAAYIHQTAQIVNAQPGFAERIRRAPYSTAKPLLMELPGVGEKIADCVLLFGAQKLEAFPIDTWIRKALENIYGLSGWKPEQIAQFARIHFGPSAGLAQQYLFAAIRSGIIA